jgi:hypothetical protein
MRTREPVLALQLAVLKETLTAQNRRYSRILGSQFQLPQSNVRTHAYLRLFAPP